MRLNYESLIVPVVAGLGYVVWHVEKRNLGRKILLRVYIDVSRDSDKSGINFDDCSRISRQVGAMLDVEAPTLGNYILEVSSPGLDRSLFKLEHYRAYVGNRARIVLKQPINGQREFVGEIRKVVGDNVELNVEDEIIVLAMDNISKAKLILDSLR